MRFAYRLAAQGLVVAALTFAASCGGAAPAANGPLDEDLLGRLDVAAPTEISWTRTIEDIEIAGVGTRPDPTELALLGAALREVPRSIREAARPDAIFRVTDSYGDTLDEATFAFSRGSNVYLLDRTFRNGSGLISRMDLARVLTHELSHVAQFHSLTNEDVAAILDSSAAVKDPITASALVRDYAASVGWSNRSTDPANPEWTLESPVGTTSYGRTAPEEDMADVVSLLALGRADGISQDRIDWVESWLDITQVALVAGKPYIPPGAQPVGTAQPLFDVQAVSGYGAAHTEAESYQLSGITMPGEQLAADLGGHLGTRGMAGSLTRTDDPRIARYAGYFLRGDGVGFWVELWDFRDAPGFANPPDQPVLTYVVLW